MMNSSESNKNPKLRVGIIGMGRMGQIRYRTVVDNPDTEVVAICDVDPYNLEGFQGIKTYAEYQDLLEEELDAVYVCAFNHLAPIIVKKALKKGYHVFCEKPPARTSQEVEEVIEIEKQHPGLKLMYGFNHRQHYAIIDTKNILASKRYGEILWLRGVYGKAGSLDFENNWRNNANYSGGGILIDQGIHMLDLFLYLCNDFDEVQSVVTTSFWDIPVEDNAFAILRNSKTNQVALLHSSATQWKHKFSLEIGLENGYINLNGILSSTRSYGDETITSARRQFEDEAKAFGKPREETIFYDRDDSWKLETEHFVECILSDKPVQNGSSRDALRVMQLVEEIYKKGKMEKDG